PCRGEMSLRAFDKRIDHPFFARLVEGDGELVAFDRDDVAVAEFLVEHALADAVRRGGTRPACPPPPRAGQPPAPAGRPLCRCRRSRRNRAAWRGSPGRAATRAFGSSNQTIPWRRSAK